jgi:putative DNA primase/helicase
VGQLRWICWERNIDDSAEPTLRERHLAEFKASAIAEDIIELNFRSWNPGDENDLDEVFTLLVPEPEHRNNGTLAGRANERLANTLRSGGWIFDGYKGVSVKPNSPRTDSEGKVIKYESPRGVGNQQIFIPCVCVRVGRIIATKIGRDAAIEYAQRTELHLPESEDTGFWEWFLSTGFSLIISEGAKKAAALVSAGSAAIALNGVWGWGNNVKDLFGEVEKGNRGENLKTLHADLKQFLNGREIVLAFDRDDNPNTIRTVERAKTLFLREIEGKASRITQMKWRGHKGADDYIAAKGSEALDRAYANRSAMTQPKPQEERQTCGDALLEIGKTVTYFHTADKISYADIWISQGEGFANEGHRHTYAVRSRKRTP